MFARACRRCVLQTRQATVPAARTQCRRYSASSSTVAAAQPISKAGLLAPFVNELDKKAPSFDIKGDQIQIIQTPAEFYQTLKVCDGSTGYDELGVNTVRTKSAMRNHESSCRHCILEKQRAS